ncbi:MAG: hypothetical protein B7Z55_16140, partial [Planctomycetales bacterium 12-60-4]
MHELYDADGGKRLVQSSKVVGDRTPGSDGIVAAGVAVRRSVDRTLSPIVESFLFVCTASIEGQHRAMDISILTCPKCNAMVLSDAAKCHVCDHVLDQDRTADVEIPALPTDNAVAEDLEACKECGETYRRGLVRCWNCGAFTRSEIKEAYH